MFVSFFYLLMIFLVSFLLCLVLLRFISVLCCFVSVVSRFISFRFCFVSCFTIPHYFVLESNLFPSRCNILSMKI